MAFSAIHFLVDATASLVALDESDGLLDFRAAFHSFEPPVQKGIRNAPVLLSLVVCARILQVVVSVLFTKPTDYTLSDDRYDTSLSAFWVLLSLLPASMISEKLQRMNQMVALWSARIFWLHYVA
jgi:hypothetical protein